MCFVAITSALYLVMWAKMYDIAPNKKRVRQQSSQLFQLVLEIFATLYIEMFKF